MNEDIKSEDITPKAPAIEHDHEKEKKFVSPQAWLWIKKYSFLFLLLIPIILSIYLRTMPVYLPFTEQKAEDEVLLGLKNQISKIVNTQYSHLPLENRDLLVKEQYENYLQEHKQEIDQVIHQQSKNYKDFYQDDTGHTYLFEVDPWHWYRLAGNYIDHGYDRNLAYNGKYYDTYVYAGLPLDKRSGITKKIDTFHVFIIVLFYKIVSFFNYSIALTTVMFYVPLIFSVLFLIPAFFIGRKLAGNIGGFFAALFLSFHKALMLKTSAGFSDTDPYSVFFPLMIIWLFIEAWDAEKKWIKIALSIGAGLLVGLYSWAWSGWWNIFYLIVITTFVTGVCSLVYFLRHHKNKKMFEIIKETGVLTKVPLILISLFIIVGIISASLAMGLSRIYYSLLNLVTAPFTFISMKSLGTSNLWPNVFTSVSELKSTTIINVISSLGGLLLFFIILSGVLLYLLYFLFYYNETSHQSIPKFLTFFLLLWLAIIIKMTANFQNMILYLVLLSLPFIIAFLIGLWYGTSFNHVVLYVNLLLLWFFASFYAASQGARFSMLIVPPLALFFGVAVHTFYQCIVSFFKQKFSGIGRIVKVIVLIIFLIILIQPFKESYVLVHSELNAPLLNDQWYDLLINIDKKAAPNAIINSWWDFGHWFKAIGNRATTLDGGNQNSPQAHWLGKLLLTDNEYESMGILRMLDCGANTAFDELGELFNHNQVKTKKVIDHIILLSKSEAKKYLLEQDLTEEQAEHILQYTHCQPPENYLIISSEMIPTSQYWAHFGSWNFSRANLVYLVNKGNKTEAISFMESDLELSQDQSEALYNEVKVNGSSDKATTWIAPWYSYRPFLNQCKQINSDLICKDKLIVNLITHQTYQETINGDKVYPIISSFIDRDGNYTVENLEHSNKTFLTTREGDVLGVSIYLDQKGKYYTFYMDPIIVASMFNKMMLFSDHIKFNCFDLFDSKGFISKKNKIQVWKVDWDCS